MPNSPRIAKEQSSFYAEVVHQVDILASKHLFDFPALGSFPYHFDVKGHKRSYLRHFSCFSLLGETKLNSLRAALSHLRYF